MSAAIRRLKLVAEKAQEAERRAQRIDPDAAPRWSPLADNPPQAAAFSSPADHMLFGGLAGSGKSALLVGLSLTAHTKSLLLRRQATQLPEITSYLRDCLLVGDKFAQVGHGARVVTRDGRRIELSGCDSIAEAQKYKGRAHDLKGYDELVDWPEAVFRFVNIWNRTTVPNQRCRVVGASNPPTTAEGEWVIRYWGPWLDPQHGSIIPSGELGWFVRHPKENRDVLVDGPNPVTVAGELLRPHSRTFVPGVMVTQLKDAGYETSLQALPDELRDIYLKGDFRAAKKDHENQLIPSAWVLAAVARGRKEDWRQRPGRFGFPSPPFRSLSSLGVDPAGGGVDETSLAPAYGTVVGPLWSYQGRETSNGAVLAAKVITVTEQNPEAIVRLDTTGGWGNECYGLLVRGDIPARHVDPVGFGTKTNFRDKSGRLSFQDLRSAMWWNLREMLNPTVPEGQVVTLPDDPRLFADLTAPRWRLMPGSVVQVEPKQSRQGVTVVGSAMWGIRDRLGRSPDRGDAVAMALWPGEPAPALFGWAGSSKKK